MKTAAHARFDLLLSALGTLAPRAVTPASLARRRDWALRRLIRYGARFSPYYRELFSGSGISLDGVRTEADLGVIPVLAGETVRSECDRIASSELDLCLAPRRATHGASGRPLAIPVFPWENPFDAYLWLRGYRARGLKAGHLQVKIALPGRARRGGHWPQRLGAFRRAHIAVTASPEEKVRRLRELKPDSLVGWASALNEISVCLEQRREFLEIPLVFSTSDMLWPEARRRVEYRLRARVTDVYGAVETGPIAWECPQSGGYHVQSDLVLVEILDEGGRAASKGRVVCTVLWRRGFPLIRYALGDLAEWAEGSCPCGSPLPLLRLIHGREGDLVRLPDGQWITPVTLRFPAMETPGIRQYQFIQEAPDSFLLRIVPGPDFAEGAENEIARRFRERFGPSLRLKIERQPEMATSGGTKFAPVLTLERRRQIGLITAEEETLR